MQNWDGKRVVIVGAARQGSALARYMVPQGAFVVINDQKTETELADFRDSLRDISDVGHPVKWVYGGHPLRLLDDCDALCISGGVPLDIPLIREAFNREIPVLNDSQIFLEEAPCPVIGITGSAGKTTTTLLVGKILEEAVNAPDSVFSGRRIWLGGNIGNPLLSNLADMQSHDIAVLELSSFQLEIMTASPHIAAVLNVYPDHLDRHKTMQDYISAKSKIVAFQSSSDYAVLNRDNEYSWSFSSMTNAKILSFGISETEIYYEGAFIKQGEMYLRKGGVSFSGRNVTNNKEDTPLIEERIMLIRDIPLRGEHNLNNVLAASTITFAEGVSAEVIQSGIQGFTGAPHRLEFIRTWNGTEWYNDSIATTPQRTAAAINCFDKNLVLLAGGRDKDLPWREVLDLIRQKVKTLIIFGELSEKLSEELGPHGGELLEVIICEGLAEAVKYAADIVQPGDVVLLSPGGTSFDEFTSYEERGQCFKTWVRELQ